MSFNEVRINSLFVRSDDVSTARAALLEHSDTVLLSGNLEHVSVRGRSPTVYAYNGCSLSAFGAGILHIHHWG